VHRLRRLFCLLKPPERPRARSGWPSPRPAGSTTIHYPMCFITLLSVDKLPARWTATLLPYAASDHGGSGAPHRWPSSDVDSGPAIL